MKRKTMVSIFAGFLAFIMLLGLILAIIPTSAFAASSSSIKSELENLKDKAGEIKKQQNELSQKQKKNESDTADLITQKKDIDQEIKLIHDEINNINAQIQTYNQLIAEKQKELDGAKVQQKQLNEQYAARIRAMEKSSDISYWSVLFESNGFGEFISNVRMMADIAKADQKMMAELEAVANTIAQTQTELSTEKEGLNEQREELNASQAELDEKSAEAAVLLDELNDYAAEMNDLQDSYAAQKDELNKDIAEKEKEYTEALKKEEEAEKKKEEEENKGGGSGGSGGSGDSGSGGGGGGGSWGYPLPYRAPITSSYGWRTNPVSGKRSFHNGVDLGAGSGTAIYATRSGTVTTSAYSDVYGYYVTVNHGDGYSSMYAHMTNYVVSNGQTVSKGQLLGYVGSTGWSTGPHLHFTIFYNGNSVNPMNYI